MLCDRLPQIHNERFGEGTVPSRAMLRHVQRFPARYPRTGRANVD